MASMTIVSAVPSYQDISDFRDFAWLEGPAAGGQINEIIYM